jgi:hypothetical protein
MVANAIQRNDARRRIRRTVWQAHVRTGQAWARGYEHIAAAARSAGVDLDADGIELQGDDAPR